MTWQVPVGPIGVTVQGSSPLSGRIRDEFRGSTLHATDAPKVTLTADAAFPTLPTTLSQAGRHFPYRYSVALHDDGVEFMLAARLGPPLYRVRIDGVPFSAERLDAAVSVPLAGEDGIRRGADPLARIVTRDFTDFLGMLAKNVIYEILDPLVLAVLLEHSASFVHAGAVVDDQGRGVLLMGTGGVGKTTTVFDLTLNGKWRYLGDDLVVASPSGLFRYPKQMQVYAYNAELVPGVDRRVLAGRGRIDLMAWAARRRLLGPANVRRRVPPSTVLGPDSVADSGTLEVAAKLTAAPHLSEVRVTEMRAAPMARQAASVIVEEFWDFLRFTNAAATLTADLPTLAEIHDRIRGVLEQVLEPVTCVELLVPPRTPGREISAALQAVLPRA